MSERIDLSEERGGKVMALDRGALHRVIGVRELFAIGYGDVGSSIYYALGITTLYALGATPLALALAGIVFFCTVLTYTELASSIHEAGGSCSFARHAFNDLTSFIAGWALLLDYIVTIAISAYTVGPYLSHFLPILRTTIGNVPFTLLVLALLFLLNFIGVKESTRVALLLCVFDIATQLTIIVIGALFLFNFPYLLDHMRIGVPNTEWSPTWPQFLKGISMAMVAYIGIESISQLAGETRHAGRKIPVAMFATMITLFIMYFGLSTVALSVIPPKVLSTTYLEDPLAGIVKYLPIGQEILSPMIGLLGATILFVAANAGLIGASRLTFSMSENFQLPRFLYHLHPRFKTPYVSLAIFAGIAGLIVLVARKLTFIAELYNFGAMLAFALAHLSLIGLRFRQPNLLRPFRAPFGLSIRGVSIPVTALLGLLGTVAVWIDVVITKPAGRNVGFLWMGLGLTLYYAYRRQQHISPSAKVEIEKLKIPGFERLKIQSILVPLRGGLPQENIQIACQIARENGAKVIALHVIEIPSTLPLDTFLPEKLTEADLILHQASAVGREYDIPVEIEVQQSRLAGSTIVDMAKEKGCDLIVLGEQAGKKTVGGLGSTVDHVLKNAPCRVWVCKGNAATVSSEKSSP